MGCAPVVQNSMPCKYGDGQEDHQIYQTTMEVNSFTEWKQKMVVLDLTLIELMSK